MKEKEPWICVRGGGDLATGTIHRLHQAGFRVGVLETEAPSAIRRNVSFCEAVYAGEMCIEGVTARKVENQKEMEKIWQQNEIPVLTDPLGISIHEGCPFVVVDAMIAKRNLGTYRNMAPHTIALGPGFIAGEDVDYVIETKRGHDLGRIIREGSAVPNTGIPGNIGGYSKERVIHASCAGTFEEVRKIGDLVKLGETIGYIRTDSQKTAVPASLEGVLRGIIRDGYKVTEGFKIADIDPRKEEKKNCHTISDKARCIAGSVLELVCRFYREREDAEKMKNL